MKGTFYNERKNLLIIHTDLISPRDYPGYEKMKEIFEMGYLLRVAQFGSDELIMYVSDMLLKHPGLHITEYC